jgi:predicted lipoprotein
VWWQLAATSVLPHLRQEARKFAEVGTLHAQDAPRNSAEKSTAIIEEKEAGKEEEKEVKEEEMKVKSSRLLGRVRKVKAAPLSSVSSLKSSPSSFSAPFKSLDLEEAGRLAMLRYADASSSSSSASPLKGAASLSVLCRTPLQVTAACGLPFIKEITLDFLEVHGLREAVQEIKEAKKIAVVATPRIIKPNEERLYTFYLRLRADALLVRSAGFLNQLLELGGAGTQLTNSNITIPDLRGTYVRTAVYTVPSGSVRGERTLWSKMCTVSN